MPTTIKPYVAISACLAGEKVRYDATDKLSVSSLRLAEHFELISFCPEMLMGLGTPREIISLYEDNSIWQIVGDLSSTNYTHLADTAMSEIRKTLGGKRIAGFVMKSRSPSCALGSYTPPQDNLSRDGLIAERLRLEFPCALFIDEQQLEDETAFNVFVNTLKHES